MTRERFDLPEQPGTYALLIKLSRRLRLPNARLQRPTLAPGIYVYCGSARGPGGLAARIGRHLRRDKAIRWHVDHLTMTGRVLDVLCLPQDPGVSAQPSESECDIAQGYLLLPGVSMPVAGLGSSDCRKCRSHLLLVSTNFELTI